PGDAPFRITTPGKHARYIRVTANKLFERTNDWIFALAELAVFSGGRNVAVGASVTSMDSIEAPPAWARTNLVDGQSVYSTVGSDESSTTNGYHGLISTSSESEKWVQVELPASATIEEVRLIPARPTDFADTPGFGFPLRFKIEVSDDPTFASPTALADHTTGDFPSPGYDPFIVRPDSKRGRFVRVTATRLWERTKGAGDLVFALAELQVHSGGRNVALGAKVSSADSIEEGRWAQRYLVDGYSSRERLEKPPDWIGALATSTHGAEMRSLEQKRHELVAALLDEPTRAALKETPEKLAAVNAQISTLPIARQVYAAVPLSKPRPVHLLARGDVKQPKQLMAAGPLKVFAGNDATFALDKPDDEGARRAALAEWITAEKNLLTRRSIVNRVWHYHFGKGIVDSPNDFGHMGAAPTHPELLDWLAFWFMDNGESLKALHKLIVTSATYRQSSAPSEAQEKIDADNRYLWRMNRTRLDAESLHDAMLLVTGKLDLKMGGPSVQQFFFKDGESPVYDYTRFDVDDPTSFRRSIYRFTVRSVPDPLMDTLDCPDPSVLSPKRNTTLTALQALSLLNNPLVVRQSEHFAARVAKQTSDPAGQIALAYRLALGRPPTAEEAKLMIDHAAKFGMANVCRVIFNSNEFVFVD
ncbi:MAG: DUF1553 domain-containing protein, partial [Tepidisphaeraceae bacterium]